MTNLKETNFLDITFKLTNATIHPYKKPIDKLTHIHTSSKYAIKIIKQLPNEMNEILCHNSSNETIFNSTSWIWKCCKVERLCVSLIKSIKTNVTKIFFHLLRKKFPRTDKLRKLFNRNTTEVSYGCIESFGQII